MRRLIALGLVALAAASGCVAYRTLRGSSAAFLTPAGTRLVINRPAASVVPVIQQLFAERGFQFVSVAQPQPSTQVLFFKGSRALVATQNNTTDALYGAGGQVGSWFAVRVVEESYHSTVTFYGKPTLAGQEVCADADDQLRDVKYQCTDTRVQADWPGFQLVEGREETQVITQVTTTLTSRLPQLP